MNKKNILWLLISLIFLVLFFGFWWGKSGEQNLASPNFAQEKKENTLTQEEIEKRKELFEKLKDTYYSEVCDENMKRYKTPEEAKKAGLKNYQFGATFCPEYKMDPSWDRDFDGKNDCYKENSCSSDVDYTTPRVEKKGGISKKRYTPEEYQKLLGVGIDVDWVKVKSIQENYISQIPKDFKKMGFSHIRIRVKDEIKNWEFKKELKRVVKDSLETGLIPVLAYRATDFKIKADKKTEEEAIAWWKKTAEIFKNYPPELSFNLIIEVTEGLNTKPDLLNDFYKKAIAEIRKTNPKRIIIISPVVRSAPEKLNTLIFPKDDKNIMAEFHFYASGPDKENSKKKWTIGTEYEKNLIRNKIKLALDFQKKTGRQVWVGAWMAGNYNKGDNYSIAEQEKFATFVAGELQKAKIPYAINSGKRFYDYEKKEPIKNMEKLRKIITGWISAH